MAQAVAAVSDVNAWSEVDAARRRDPVITVLLIDDQQQVLRGLEMLLALAEDVHVVGTAGTAEAGLELARRLRPDIVVMDVQLPGIDGLSATSQLRRELPGCGIVVLTLYGDAETRQRAMGVGADAFLAKHDGDTPLLDTIRRVVARRHSP